MDKLRTLYINADKDKSHCSIYEAGDSLLDAFELSSTMDVTYASLGCESISPTTDYINENYDLVIFNYHFVTMGFLPFSWVRAIRKPKFGITFDAHPNQVWEVQSHWGPLSELFDYMAFPDPTLEITNDRTLALPRMVLRYQTQPHIKRQVPLISVFGLHTNWKNLDLIVDAINHEFEFAKFRMKFSNPDQADRDYTFDIKRNMAGLSKRFHAGISVSYTMEFMDIYKLIGWLNESDLNIFFYEEARDTIGAHIPCSVDQGIAAQRPMAVTDVLTLRHTKPYLTPYPEISLKEAMEQSLPGVMKMYEEWSPKNFIGIMDEFLLEKDELWSSR